MGYYVISPLIGAGTARDPLRPKVGEYGGYASISNDTWSLSFSEADPAVVDADIDVLRIPENRLGRSINNNQASSINAHLEAYGAPPLVSGGMTILDCINAIGGWLQPGWTYTNFYVAP